MIPITRSPSVLLLFLVLVWGVCGEANAQPLAWHYIGAPEGGYVRSLYVSPSGEVIASMYEHGNYVSTDGGANWRSIPGLRSAWRLIGGGGTIPLYADSLGSLIRSTDRGLTWSPVSGAALSPGGGHAVDSSGVFIDVDGAGIRRSTDEGRSWTTVASYMSNSFSTAVSVAAAGSGGTFYGVVFYPEETTSKRVLRSTDHGRTWTFALGDSLAVNALAVAGDGALYLAESSGLVRSTVDGTGFARLVHESISTVAIGHDDEVIAATQYGVMVSTDRGATWSTAARSATSRYVCAVPVGSRSILVGTFTEGVLGTEDRTSWSRMNHGLDATRIATIGWLAPGRLYAASGSFISISKDEGRTWETMTTPSPRPSENMIPVRLGVPVVQSASGAILTPVLDTLGFGLARTRDDGSTWSVLRGAPHNYFWCMVSAPDGELFVCGDSGTVYRSSDDGDSWRLFADFGVDETITDIDFAGDTVLFSGFGSGAISMRSRLDGRALGQYDTGPSFSVSQLVIDRLGRLYARGQQNIVRSTDRGRSWSVIGPESGNYPLDVAIDSLGRIFISYDVGGDVYASTDGGRTWKRPAGLDLTIPSLVSTPSGVMLAGCGPGLFRLDAVAAVTPDADEPDEVVRRDRMIPEPVPNPAVDCSVIRFRLDREARVVVRVRDLLGAEVFATMPAPMSAGMHAVPVDLRAVPPGIYSCSVETGDVTRTARLVILR